MTLLRRLGQSLLTGGFVGLMGCTYDDKEHLCPSCTNTLYIHDACFGDYSIGDSEKDFQHSCGNPPATFEFYDGHDGGIGDTLEYLGCNNSVYLHHSYGALDLISVMQGGEGTTDSGLHPGSSTLSDFLQAYPTAQPREIYPWWYQKELFGNLWTVGHLKASFDDFDILCALEVGTYNYNNDNPTDPVFPIKPNTGPDPWYCGGAPLTTNDRDWNYLIVPQQPFPLPPLLLPLTGHSQILDKR